MTNTLNNTPQHSDVDAVKLRQHIQRLNRVHEITTRLGLITDVDTLTAEIVRCVQGIAGFGRVILLILDDESAGLKFKAINTPPNDKSVQDKLNRAYIKTFNSDDAQVKQLLNGEIIISAVEVEKPLSQLAQIADFGRFVALPLLAKTELLGGLMIELDAETAITALDREVLEVTAANAAVILQNARQHAQTVAQLADQMHQMSILQQIDRELNDTIELNTVFNMTLDWALRFTNANTASISLFDEEADTLRTMFNYGYTIPDAQIEMLRGQARGGVAHRVAHTGRAEVVPDVTIDPDYQPIEQNIISQMSVPVLREERVIAVITLESKKVNAFTDGHLEFVTNLANRAAVAIDNARLYTESERERDKLSHILGNIVDIVIVIGKDERIVLMNQSAISALRLYSEAEYVGKAFEDAITFKPLVDFYKNAKKVDDNVTDELTLPSKRVFYTKADFHESIGWILVMQDVTPYKEMDRLKSELIATVSHDLKQPLSVMRGYLDLLQMKNEFDSSSENFINMIDRSIINMRQLIDDLLDLAKIESGIDLSVDSVQLGDLLRDIIEVNKGGALAKSMTMIEDLPDDLLVVKGEQARLHQIFNNLVSNAIKYTPPEGEVRVWAEKRGASVRVGVKDNGLGISPEDQAHIFERFYRVRRPETESIDGTGLGLAIVKSLVEAHQGTIRLESTLGEGSTFYVTLPLIDDEVSIAS